ncbi:hypothetical protein MP478_12545 [Chryseobacterium sp. WG14]|uniref:DUF6705 family protein n=1 Tax=unclassified Chryseobacterium TaxID=2593645 RepID=UPI00211EE370|nr:MULTISPECIES: DUF6705 family protein [unclassified Chryseobacterium]MCQ9636119.1 hypothetical protein [Chryseobacterium sp. WG23]MCQ9640209.1 hypothetical protein [Chryseobacterium sp. WG14]
MKKIILILLLSCINKINAQQIFPLNTPKINIPNGAYYKDLDGELDPYIGIWKGTWDGKTLYLQLKKVKDRSVANDGTYYESDQIMGERKVIAANGTVEIDHISNFNQNSPEFYGIFGQYNNFVQKYLLFQPKNMCNSRGNVDINFIGNQKEQIKLHYKLMPMHISKGCENSNQQYQNDMPINLNFPKDIVLTKQ